MKVPEAELDVLAVLWREGAQTAAQIRKKLTGKRDLSHASVLTLLGRLQDRELVCIEDEKQRKAFIFRAVHPRKVQGQLARDFVERVFDGCRFDLVTTLLNTKLPTDQELDQLQETLNKLRSKKRGSNS